MGEEYATALKSSWIKSSPKKLENANRYYYK